MTFTEALSAIFNDSDHCTRRAWNSRAIYVLLEDSKLCICGYASEGKDDGLPHPWVITESDFFSDDWEIINDG